MCDRDIKIEKLRGRENYDTWKQSARSYLTIKGVWEVIDQKIPATVSPKTNAKAIGEITLMVDMSLYSYLEESEDAYVVWYGLAKAFEDSGVARKVTILNQLVSVKLVKYKSMERYINTTLQYWNKTKVAGLQINEEVIASLLLGGLPDEFRPMILGIENSGQDLTIDYVKQVLLQGIPDPYEIKEEDLAMPVVMTDTKERSKGYKGKRSCFKCGDTLHLRVNCPKRDLKCSECGASYHLVENCPLRKADCSENGWNDKQNIEM